MHAPYDSSFQFPQRWLSEYLYFNILFILLIALNPFLSEFQVNENHMLSFCFNLFFSVLRVLFRFIGYTEVITLLWVQYFTVWTVLLKKSLPSVLLVSMVSSFRDCSPAWFPSSTCIQRGITVGYKRPVRLGIKGLHLELQPHPPAQASGSSLVYRCNPIGLSIFWETVLHREPSFT